MLGSNASLISMKEEGGRKIGDRIQDILGTFWLGRWGLPEPVTSKRSSLSRGNGLAAGNSLGEAWPWYEHDGGDRGPTVMAVIQLCSSQQTLFKEIQAIHCHDHYNHFHLFSALVDRS